MLVAACAANLGILPPPVRAALRTRTNPATVLTLLASSAESAATVANPRLPSPVPFQDSALTATQTWCVRLATPLLLYGADMRRLVGSAGRLTGAFALGAAGSTLGMILGFAVVAQPMALIGDPANGAHDDFSHAAPRHCLARLHLIRSSWLSRLHVIFIFTGDGWKLGAALLAKNIGGGVNYVAVAATTGVSSSAVAAGLAVDNLFGLLYFPLVNWLGSRHSDTIDRVDGAAAAAEITLERGSRSELDAIAAERIGTGEAASTSAAGGAGNGASAAQQGEFGTVEDCLTAIALATAASALSEAIAPTAAMPVATALTGAARIPYESVSTAECDRAPICFH